MAAKEFETELKKEPDGSVEPPPIEKPTGVSNDDETKQKELEASGTREGQDTS
ncbi:hypothetical protein QJS04_geneDACA021869 [Acorus gramineus]|uniref:Uncharacterized protein n=1 Tax=Acorus gramineus TaxID=55184 RepID=A0AAV9ASH2_ACOGR|nr:hypothetical protein QJS04_geneDACA021869 [Acorus gramineus]